MGFSFSSPSALVSVSYLLSSVHGDGRVVVDEGEG